MSKTEDGPSSEQAKVPLSPNILNTSLAADRTLMAWIRTALSMFTFGFTLFKVLQAVQGAENNLPSENTPRNAGMTLVAIGVAAVLMGVWDFRHTRAQLGTIAGHKLPRSSMIVMAFFTVAIGIFLLFVIFTRLF